MTSANHFEPESVRHGWLVAQTPLNPPSGEGGKKKWSLVNGKSMVRGINAYPGDSHVDACAFNPPPQPGHPPRVGFGMGPGPRTWPLVLAARRASRPEVALDPSRLILDGLAGGRG